MLDQPRLKACGDGGPTDRSLANLVLTVVGSAVKSLRRHAPRVLRSAQQGLPGKRGTVHTCSLSVRDGIPPLGGREVWTSPIRSDSIDFDRAIGRSTSTVPSHRA